METVYIFIVKKFFFVKNISFTVINLNNKKKNFLKD